MSNLVDMFAWRNEGKKTKEVETVTYEDMVSLMERNAENKRRVEEERKQANKKVVSSHKLKG